MCIKVYYSCPIFPQSGFKKNRGGALPHNPWIPKVLPATAAAELSPIRSQSHQQVLKKQH